LVAVYVADVALPILLKVELFVDDCHWIDPEYPLNVNIVLFVPDVTVPAPEMVPEAEPTAKLMDRLEVELPSEIVIVPV
jgi:hypothetical protein